MSTALSTSTYYSYVNVHPRCTEHGQRCGTGALFWTYCNTKFIPTEVPKHSVAIQGVMKKCYCIKMCKYSTKFAKWRCNLFNYNANTRVCVLYEATGQNSTYLEGGYSGWLAPQC